MWIQELRFAVRQLLKHPGFSAIAVLTLALGVGANTAIFSLINGVLLKPLPFREPDRLVRLFDRVNSGKDDRVPVAFPNFLDWRAQSTGFEGMAAQHYTGFNLTGEGEPRRLNGLSVTPNLLPLLGISPALGRGFRQEEQEVGQHRVVMLSHTLWQTQFGSDPSWIGRTLQLDGESYTVVGVLPADLRYPSRELDLWVPAAPSAEERLQRGSHRWEVVGRLKPNVSEVQAAAELNVIATRLAAQYEDNRDFGVTVVGLHDELVGPSRKPLWILLGAVTCVLLIACANVANLQLARAASREREFAVRGALGAGRAQILRQLLTESSLLALAGGSLGILFAAWAVSAFIAWGPKDLPRLADVRLSWPVLMFSLGVSILTGLASGLAPAFQAARADVNDVLKDSGRGTTEGRRRSRLRATLVVLEVALSLVLLAGAGLLLRSFVKVRSVDPGFQSAGILTADLAVPERKYPTEQQQAALIARVLERIRLLPGVTSASAVFGLPMGNMVSRSTFQIEGRPLPTTGQPDNAAYHQIAPDYFRTLGAVMLTGRDFDRRDSTNAPQVAIVNEAFMRAFFPNENPRQLPTQRINLDQGTNSWIQIVGITRDMRHRGPAEAPEPEMYFPLTQRCWGFVSLVVRTSGDPGSMVQPVRQAVAEVDGEQPLDRVRPLSGLLQDSLSSRRLQALLLGSFSVLALVLAAVGIYGVMAWSVSRRTHEIGIRIALGAQWRDVLRLVVRQGMTPAVLGVGFGLAGGLGLAQFLASLLYEIQPHDPPTFGVVTVLLLAVALLACWIPARRASRVDPMVALRGD